MTRAGTGDSTRRSPAASISLSTVLGRRTRGRISTTCASSNATKATSSSRATRSSSSSSLRRRTTTRPTKRPHPPRPQAERADAHDRGGAGTRSTSLCSRRHEHCIGGHGRLADHERQSQHHAIVPLGICNVTAAGFDSSVQPAPFTFSQPVASNTNTTFFYCKVGAHSLDGMFGLLDLPCVGDVNNPASVGTAMAALAANSNEFSNMMAEIQAINTSCSAAGPTG